MIVEQTEAQAEAFIRSTRARKALENAASVAEHLRSLLEPSDGRTERGETPTDRSPLLTAIADDADELYVVLLEWVGYWSAELQQAPPVTQIVASRNFQWSHASVGHRDATVLGFKAGTTPRGARGLVQILATWLLIRENAIALDPMAETYQDEVAQLVWRLRAGHGLLHEAPIREALGRVCASCGQPEVRAEFFGESLSTAEARGEFDVMATASHDDRRDPGSAAGRVILSAVDGVGIRCGYCGWTAKPRAIEIAWWLQ